MIDPYADIWGGGYGWPVGWPSSDFTGGPSGGYGGYGGWGFPGGGMGGWGFPIPGMGGWGFPIPGIPTNPTGGGSSSGNPNSPLNIIGTIGGIAGPIVGALLSTSGSKKAADAQVQAALAAAAMQKDASDKALAEQQRQFDVNQTNIKPWLTAGTGALGQLSGQLSTPGEGLLTPWTEQFAAPTNVTEQNDPGYQFRLDQGMKLLQQSAAAKGNLLTGGTAKALTQYGQDYASGEYGNVYNRAFNEYANKYNIFQNNQSTAYNRLASMAGVGQTAATQLGQLGQNSANNVSNILMATGAAQGGYAQDAGAARATGYQNAGNIWGNTIGKGISNLPYLLQQYGYGKG